MTEEYPLPENPVASKLIDPVEEAHVAESEHYAEIRERDMQEFMALRAARDAAANPAPLSPESTISEVRLAANHANAKLSSGPVTSEGKTNIIAQ